MPKEINRDKKKKYTVWSQGPDDALSKKMKRTFKQTTPGQVRDYATLVKSRSFQRFEQVKRTDEDGTPANATGPAIANWHPKLGDENAPTVWVRKKRKVNMDDNKIDGRTLAYRTVTKRIKERNAKAAEREATQKLSQFGVTSNPFREANEMDNKKYLKTKEGSIEQAVLDSLNTETPVNPNSLRPTLTLPKNRYLETKDASVEYQAIKAVAEVHKPGHKLPRQYKGDGSDKMVGVKDKSGKVQTKVVDKKDPKYKDHPLHASVEHDEDLTEKGWFPGMDKKKGEAGGGATSGTSDAETDKSEKKFRKQKDQKRGASSSSGLSKFKFFQKKDKDDQEDDPVGDDKDTETQTDKKDNGDDTETQTSKKNGDDEENGKTKKKGKKQNFFDKDREATATRSKDRPTAESFSAILDEKKEQYWIEKRKSQNLRPTTEEVDEDDEYESVFITSLEQLDELDHEEFGFETRDEMVEYVAIELHEKDSRRTVDAIRAYYRSKDASRDATSDTDKGKKGKGDVEKDYAKKERGEIKKDDPDWKHKKGHTGMHGEDVELDEYRGGPGLQGPGVSRPTKRGPVRDLVHRSGVPDDPKDPRKRFSANQHAAANVKGTVKNIGQALKSKLRRSEYEPQGTEIDEQEVEMEQHPGKNYYRDRSRRWKEGEFGPRDAPKKKERTGPKKKGMQAAEYVPQEEAKDSFDVPSSASPSKTAPGEGGIPKPSDAKIDGDVKNVKKKQHKDAKEVQDIDNREANVGESMSPLMAAVVKELGRKRL